MSNLHRVVVHHPSTDTYWYSAFEDHGDLEGLESLLKSICDSGGYVTFKNSNGDPVFFPKNMIQECVFTVEGSKEND